MNALKQRWRSLADRIDAMTLRERALIFVAAAAVLLSMTNVLLINPLLARHKLLSEQIVQAQATTAVMQTQIQTLLQSGSQNPNAALKLKLDALRAQSAASGKTLGDIQSRLVSPQQMPTLLENLLRQNRNVHLLALKTLPVEPLEAQPDDHPATQTHPAPKSAAAGEAAIYKHGVEITLSGNYFDLLHYMSAIENLPWRMFWGRAELSVDDAHTIRLTLRLYTLSQDAAWLST